MPSALYQNASKSLTNEDDAASGALRLFGRWTLLNRDTKDTGTLVFKVENRHRLGTNIPPSQLGFEVGYNGITGTLFSDVDSVLVDLNWQQVFNDGQGGFLKVRKMDQFRSFTELLAGQTGQLVNLNEFSNTLMVSRDTVSRYLEYLQESFLVRYLRPFTTNRRGEMVKMPKIFFTDLGLLNLLQGQPVSTMNIHRGSAMENAVEITLRNFGGDLFFWRTDRGAEVDFVWRSQGELVPIEVKAAAISRPTVSGGYRSFLKNYRPKNGILVNETLDAEVSIEDTLIRFIPFKSLADYLSVLQ